MNDKLLSKWMSKMMKSKSESNPQSQGTVDSVLKSKWRRLAMAKAKLMRR